MRGVMVRRSFGAILTRGAHAGAEAVVDVLVDAEVGLHGVDEAGEAVVVRGHAQRGLVAERGR